jgi:lipoprotein-anchoring transpeptidase ErfK/SrfK
MMEAAEREIEKGSMVEVLGKLSPLYGRSDLSAEESRQLTEMLSQLAGEVIYSRKHHLEQPYVVQPGDSLQPIAQQYRVPWQLLAKINGVQDPERLIPGSKLKVLRGPFDAVVLLDRYELVLQVNGLYAGRFPIGIGRDWPRLAGTFLVKEKMTRPTYYGPSGIIEPGEPDNPLGKYWIGLDERIGIHGTNDMRNLRRGDGQGAICLGDRDVEDVYDILSAESPSWPGSKVAIRRFAEPPDAVAERDAGMPDRR